MKNLPLWHFFGIPGYRRISKLHGINMRLGNKTHPPQSGVPQMDW
jgi:hypothetical protein